MEAAQASLEEVEVDRTANLSVSCLVVGFSEHVCIAFMLYTSLGSPALVEMNSFAARLTSLADQGLQSFALHLDEDGKSCFHDVSIRNRT